MGSSRLAAKLFFIGRIISWFQPANILRLKGFSIYMITALHNALNPSTTQAFNFKILLKIPFHQGVSSTAKIQTGDWPKSRG